MAVVMGSVCKLLRLQIPMWSQPATTKAALCTVTKSQPQQVEDALFKRVHLELCAHEKAVLQSYCTVLTTAANHLDIKTGEMIMSRKPIKNRLTLLKSVHIYKKHRVQYEVRTHKAALTLHHLTGSTADTYLEYMQRFLPEGVNMKVTRVALEAIPDYLKPPSK
ncbi:hypothetical protein B566_EDAN011873 [Ephemera danica]|nr:hypothetical protein B566_EDAN011873 [Ephemera danica]